MRFHTDRVLLVMAVHSVSVLIVSSCQCCAIVKWEHRLRVRLSPQQIVCHFVSVYFGLKHNNTRDTTLQLLVQWRGQTLTTKCYQQFEPWMDQYFRKIWIPYRSQRHFPTRGLFSCLTPIWSQNTRGNSFDMFIEINNWFVRQRHRWSTNEEIAALLIAIDKHEEWLSKEVKIR